MNNYPSTGTAVKQAITEKQIYCVDSLLSNVSGKIQGHSVFQCNPDQVQGCTRLRGDRAAGCRPVAIACPAHEPNHCIAQRRHALRDVATPYLGAIFITSHIPDPMGLVLNLPLAADQGEQPRCVGPPWPQAGHAGHHCLADCPRVFQDALALPLKHVR
jgi:hypothetical protein